MSFITEQLFTKYNEEPELNIHKGNPKDEKTECKNIISELKVNNSFFILMMGIIIVVSVIFVAITIFLPKSREVIPFIAFPICAFFIIIFGIITYKTTKKCIKRIKLAKSNGVFFKQMKCTDKDIFDGDENKFYYFQFNNELICKTNKKSFDLVSIGDTCTLVFIKGISDFSVLGYIEK